MVIRLSVGDDSRSRVLSGYVVRNWFPFSDYDFWAYLASGVLLLAGVDFAANDARLIGRSEWNVAQVTLAILAIYLVGHVVASTSSLVLESWVANKALRSPIAVLLGVESRGPIQNFLARSFIGRYYAPFSAEMRSRIVTRAAELSGTASPSIDTIFHVAFCKARESDDTRARIDSFRNQYGFCRNLALSCWVVAAVIFTARGDAPAQQLAIVLTVLGFVMFVRFLKFYSHYAAEVLRGLSLASGD